MPKVSRSMKILCAVIWLMNSSFSLRIPRSLFSDKMRQSSSVAISWPMPLIVTRMASPDGASSDVEKVKTPPVTSRPPIIPFDFARDDILPPKVIDKVVKKSISDEDISSGKKENGGYSEPAISARSTSNKWVDDTDLKTAVRSTNSRNGNKWVEDPSRPTGYGNADEDDDDWVPSADSEGVEKFLKDYFFNSPYDSPKRKDAKLVIRNVTLISGVLGTIFTILFYAFPGKFISYRGTADFSKRYSSDFITKDPSELLNDQVNEDLTRNVEVGGQRFFDDAVGLPPPDNSRVPYQIKPSEARAPGRTENL